MQQNRNIKRLFMTGACALALSAYHAVAQNSTENYVRTYIPLQNVSAGNVTGDNSFVVTTFYDQAGRRTQTVREKASPAEQDLADLTVYDSLGRVQQEWALLPFSSYTSPVSKPLSDFTSSSYALGRHVDYTYEPSALNRQTAYSSVYSSGKSVVTEHICSVPVNVYKFTVSDVGIIQNNGTVQYPMRGIVQTDEDGNVYTRYTDSRGRIMLERRGHTGSNETLDTYYVYDKLDMLACVLPPLAVSEVTVTGTYSIQTCTALQQYAYFYRYDTRNNCIAVKKPGIDWSYTVYDGDGRPIMSQTPNQQASHEWNYFRYDNLNRLCMEGTVRNTASPDSLVRQFRDVRVQDTCTGTGTYGYTESLSLGTDEKVLNVYYYDDYSCLDLGIFSTLSGTYTQASTRTRGLMTGSYTAPLRGTGYEVEVSLYDDRRRETASHADNKVTGIRTHRAYSLDYLGNPQTADVSYVCFNDSVSEHFAYTYDHLGRGTSATLDVHLMGMVNTDGYDLHLDLWTASYDELGRVASTTTVGGYNSTGRTYYNDGRLSQMQGPYYGQILYYNTGAGTHKCHNGRISLVRTTYDNDMRVTDIAYDNFGRMTQAAVTSPYEYYEETFQYDAMGNVTQLYRAQDGNTVNDMDISYYGNHINAVCDYSNYTQGNNLLYTPWSNVENAYLYDANGNETRNMSHNISHIRYNLLNLPDSVIFANGNVLTFIYMADGRRVGTDSHTGSTPLVLPGMGGYGGPQLQTVEYSEGDVTADLYGFNRLEIPGGYLTFGREFYQFTPSQGGGLSFDGEWTRGLASHFYVTDYKGSVVAVCDGATGAVQQRIDYMPSGAVFSASSYALQPYKFCGKEDITMHGFNMYDSFARYQYSRFPRFNTMDPLAEWDYATSPYAYCRNDFVNLADPWGLFPNLNDAIDFANNAYPGNYSIIYVDGEWEVMSYIGEAAVVGAKKRKPQEVEELEDSFLAYDDSYVTGHGGGGSGSSGIARTLGNLALVATAALVVDDATVVGVADDIAIPVLLIGGGICIVIDALLGDNVEDAYYDSYSEHTKGARPSTKDKHTRPRSGDFKNQNQEAKKGDKNRKYHRPPNPNKRKK